MSKYSGLDKIDSNLAAFVERYNGGKVYKDNDGFIAVKRTFVIDNQFNSLVDAKEAIDYFNLD